MTEDTKKKSTERKILISIRLPKKLKSDLQELAFEQKRPFASQIELAIEEHLLREWEKKRRAASAADNDTSE
jgi:predicted transcriptional regulator